MIPSLFRVLCVLQVQKHYKFFLRTLQCAKRKSGTWYAVHRCPKERAFEQKRKSPQTLPLIPMKSLTVWRGHSTRPSLPVGTARRASGSLPRGRRNRLIMQTTKNRKFPLGRFCPAGRKARGTGCSNPPLLLPHKIRAKQKEQHPIRCCSWCDREDSNLWPSGSENYDRAV